MSYMSEHANTLRHPQSSDYAAIGSWLPDAASCLRWAGPGLRFPFTLAELPALLAVNGGASYCLPDASGAPCGFGQHWVLTPGLVHLGRIIVAPGARGQGVGRQLCEQLIARALQASGAGAVTLRVYRDNPAALALYARLGFTPVESESSADVLFMRAAARAS